LLELILNTQYACTSNAHHSLHGLFCVQPTHAHILRYSWPPRDATMYSLFAQLRIGLILFSTNCMAYATWHDALMHATLLHGMQVKLPHQISFLNLPALFPVLHLPALLSVVQSLLLPYSEVQLLLTASHRCKYNLLSQ
jgi:hypothetical protein